MGMFDSFYDADGIEWQTKALRCLLESYEIGDAVPCGLTDHQIKVFSFPPSRNGYATLRNGFLVSVGLGREGSLPLMDYFGSWLEWEAVEHAIEGKQ
jgi:hypothetical protein